MHARIPINIRYLLLAGLLALPLLSACETEESDASPSGEGAEYQAKPIPVETLEVQAQSFTETFEIPANTAPIDEVTVAAEAGGRVLSAPFEEGESVRAGSRLLRVDTELDSARIDLLENQLETAQREYERTKKLREQGLATPQQLDQAESALENARLSLDQAKIGASKGGVRSPVSGLVERKFIEKGEFASPGAPVATIIQYDKVKVLGNVPESRVRKLSKGAAIDIYFPALDKTFSTKISRRSLTPSPRTRTYTVEAIVDNPDLVILPGMRATMRAVEKQWEEVLLVPREAVLQGFSRSEIMALPDTDDQVGEAALRVVELGPSAGPDVVVTSGLEPGAKIIVRGHRGLVDGALARRVRHFDSIEQMRTSSAAVDLGGADEDDAANEQSSAGSKAK